MPLHKANAVLYFVHLVSPVVKLLADHTRVALGGATILTCSVTKGNPATYSYTWTHPTTSILETSATLRLSSFGVEDEGNYSCEVRNDAGVGMDSITIEVGGELL